MVLRLERRLLRHLPAAQPQVLCDLLGRDLALHLVHGLHAAQPELLELTSQDSTLFILHAASLIAVGFVVAFVDVPR